ncbi:MAG: hypothetical protein V1898_03025 [Patescibacteria group bacterium]
MEETSILIAASEVADTNSNVNSVTNENTNQELQTTTEATTLNLSQQIKQLNIDWEHPSWDLFLVGFFIIGALLYGISLGKDRIIAILVSIYMALAVVHALPDFILNVKLNDNYTLQITAFISIFVILFFLLSRSAVLNSIDTSQQGKWYQVIIFSVLHIGLLISVSLSFMPEAFINQFSTTTRYVFTDQWTAFAWIIAPIVAMLLFGERED